MGGARGAMAPPIFGRSVNPIQTGEGRLSPPITTGPLNVFHLPVSLILVRESNKIVDLNVWGWSSDQNDKSFQQIK